jgi:hypothetical protein
MTVGHILIGVIENKLAYIVLLISIMIFSNNNVFQIMVLSMVFHMAFHMISRVDIFMIKKTQVNDIV